MGRGRRVISLGTALLAALSGAGASGLLVSDAAARIGRRGDDDGDPAPLLLEAPGTPPGALLAHASHSSHRSHSSHSSHYSGGGGGSSRSEYTPVYTPDPAPAPVRPPPPPKPARVSFVAFPGGRIFIDEHDRGTDATGLLTLKAGTHEVRVKNRFLGEYRGTIELGDGQTGTVTITW